MLYLLNFVKNISIFLYALVIILTLTIFFIIKYFESGTKNDIGFFHPYANDGGGGERVLWVCVQALQKRYPSYNFYIYTGDNVKPEEILFNVKKKFNISIPQDSIQFIYLKCRDLLRPEYYPVCTLLGQCFGSIILSFEAWWKKRPYIFFDTAGYAFSYPLFKFFGSIYVGCYVHYPIITEDMTKIVSDKKVQYNNSTLICKFPILSKFKMIYYIFLSKIYGLVGICSDFVFVNSSWTYSHIKKLWKNSKIHILFPPCDVTTFSQLKNESENLMTDSKEIFILSLAQFRPEKNHYKQIKAFSVLLKTLKDHKDLAKYNIKLLLVGSCRNDTDLQRVNNLKTLCETLNVTSNVDFLIDINFDELKKWMAKSLIGIHTMWNEHFGIAIVECMSAGLIMVAHDSGGPKMDILKPYNGNQIGFLADSEEEYAKYMLQIIQMPPSERNIMRQNAKLAVESQFSNEVFENKFLHFMSPYFDTNNKITSLTK